VGEHRIDASVNLNNPLKIGDQLGIRSSISQRGLVKMLGLNYSLPVDVQGTRVASSYTAVNYGIGGELSSLGIEGKSKLGSVSVVHPFLRSQQQNLFGTFGMRYFSGNQDVSGIAIADSSILVAEAGIAWNRVDKRFNVTAASLRLSDNFRSDVDGKRDTSSRFKLDGDVSHLRHLSKSWDLRLAGGAQWSSSALADSEKFSLGGPNSVRGYASADVRGDRGVFGSVEVRFRPGYISMPSYFSMFYDAGYTARRSPQAGSPKSNTIGSAGVGYTIYPTKWLAAEIAGAVPTTKLDPSDSRDSGRIWFNLTAAF
jgi:hemolysin activation/secretion protein